MDISPQGYTYGSEPLSDHPFWDEEVDVTDITASATVDDTTGAPTVTVNKEIIDNAVNFAFHFLHLKGERGEQGIQGERGEQGTQGERGEQGIQGERGEQGIQGEQGATGATPDITVTATSDATHSDSPTVNVTKSGTPESPTFALAFSGLQGEAGGAPTLQTLGMTDITGFQAGDIVQLNQQFQIVGDIDLRRAVITASGGLQIGGYETSRPYLHSITDIIVPTTTTYLYASVIGWFFMGGYNFTAPFNIVFDYMQATPTVSFSGLKDSSYISMSMTEMEVWYALLGNINGYGQTNLLNYFRVKRWS